MAPLMLLWTAAALGQPAGQAPGPDRIALTLRVDDRLLQDLQAPTLLVGDAPPQPLVDDGSVEGDVPGDHLWSAVVSLRPTPRVSLSVRDGDRTWGPIEAFLPASATAELALRTTETPPGLELVVEPVATSPVATSPGGAPAAAASDDRFAYVLWLALLFGALGVAWIRHAVRTVWQDEVRPVLRKLDRWLDEQESRENP